MPVWPLRPPLSITEQAAPPSLGLSPAQPRRPKWLPGARGTAPLSVTHASSLRDTRLLRLLSPRDGQGGSGLCRGHGSQTPSHVAGTPPEAGPRGRPPPPPSSGAESPSPPPALGRRRPPRERGALSLGCGPCGGAGSCASGDGLKGGCTPLGTAWGPLRGTCLSHHSLLPPSFQGLPWAGERVPLTLTCGRGRAGPGRVEERPLCAGLSRAYCARGTRHMCSCRPRHRQVEKAFPPPPPVLSS